MEEKTIHIEGQTTQSSWMDFTSSSDLNFQKLFELLAQNYAIRCMQEEVGYPLQTRIQRHLRYGRSLQSSCEVV